ncbi:MAG: VIT1/CCC1 transporter family protein [Bdellovibrionales bacterium]
MTQKFPRHLRHEHSPEAIRHRLKGGTRPSYLRDFVYGGIDGTITTFAVVSGVIGADLSFHTILVLGGANLLADGFSMAAANYVGTRTEHDEKILIERYERQQVERNPAGEKEEVRQILKAKGFEGQLLEDATSVLVNDRERWIQLMLAEEYGLSGELRSPLASGLSTFCAFVVCGMIPLLPFFARLPEAFLWSCAMTAAAFFAIGSFKSRYSMERWWRAGWNTLLIGSIAAILAYVLGAWLKAWIPPM